MERSGLLGLMSVLRNDGRWDTSNASYDGHRVMYDKRHPRTEMTWIDYGLGGLSADALALVAPDVDDLADLYHALAMRDELYGFAATDRFYEIGTPASLTEAEEFLSKR